MKNDASTHAKTALTITGTIRQVRLQEIQLQYSETGSPAKPNFERTSERHSEVCRRVRMLRTAHEGCVEAAHRAEERMGAQQSVTQRYCVAETGK